MIHLNLGMVIDLMAFSPTDLEFLQKMPSILSFYMNSLVGFGKFPPNLKVIHNINRSKWFALKSSTEPSLKSSKAKFQLKILL